MPATWLDSLSGWSPGYHFLLGALLLLAATQLVVIVLDKLDRYQFGPILLGTLVTPLCTGFPNLMLGLFGRNEHQADLVLQLNIGNNLANTTLVTGLILFVAGPLTVGPAKGKSKKASRARLLHAAALLFFWLSASLLFWLSRDGVVSTRDGLALTGIYFFYQWLAFRSRGKVSPRKRLGRGSGFMVLTLLGLAALLIHTSIRIMNDALEHLGGLFPGTRLGLFLGLLTVVPESFLLLRLAFQKGNLGFSGLLGDCLVSIPLVIGLSALVAPIETRSFEGWASSAFHPYLHLAVGMTAFTFISFSKMKVGRKTGLFFMALYAIVWWHAKG